MRRYHHIDSYLDELKEDIYSASDDAHKVWERQAIDNLCPRNIDTVLDVGAGIGHSQVVFNDLDIKYVGVTLDKDELEVAHHRGHNVKRCDMNFLPDGDEEFDMVYSRHSLEHSPMPLLSLMEWHRVSKRYLLLIVPAPEFWNYYGKNHYFMLNKFQWWNLYDRAGWKLIKEENFMSYDPLFVSNNVDEEGKPRKWNGPPKCIEYRFLLEKK